MEYKSVKMMGPWEVGRLSLFSLALVTSGSEGNRAIAIRYEYVYCNCTIHLCEVETSVSRGR